MNVWLYILAGIFHLIDAVFTVLYIKKARTRYENPEELELNYHKFFFKKFGTTKGIFLSVSISLPLLMLLMWVGDKWIGEWVVYFLLGLLFGVAYINYSSWSNYDETVKKLIIRKDLR